ncbi:hypothetical protein [Nitrincola sp. MINF-07-Sa-05]|uniref:hypothetical protein n=1 Tax=Nitrincola salilacus TaxID=3400273 RepID=UPI003917EF70
MNKAKLMRWAKWSLILVLILPPLKMAIEVARTPSYDSGEAYVSYSHDGKYRGGVVYIAKQHRTGWMSSSNTVYLLTDPSGKEIHAIFPMDKYWQAGSGTIWRCGERRDEACTGVRDGFLFEAQLPVSYWQRLHAWLTVRLKGLQDAEFAEVIVR